MPTPEKTDPLAAVRAVQIVTDLIDNAGNGDNLTSPAAGSAVVDGFTAGFERRDNLRRVVLTGVWEIDPTAVRAQAQLGADRVAEVATALLSA